MKHGILQVSNGPQTIELCPCLARATASNHLKQDNNMFSEHPSCLSVNHGGGHWAAYIRAKGARIIGCISSRPTVIRYSDTYKILSP